MLQYIVFAVVGVWFAAFCLSAYRLIKWALSQFAE